MRQLILIPLLFFSINLFGQIKIDDIGDNWKSRVDSALTLIKTYDSVKYGVINKYCKHITFWNGTFSTLENQETIMIAQRDMIGGSINNIAAAIVHESFHMYRWNNNLERGMNIEECLGYTYELEFLMKIPNVEPFLIEHAKEMIEFYKK
jgi:hypothetical protein